MKTIVKLGVVFCLGGVLCLAETWNGKLVDAACKDQAKQSNQSSACTPTAATNSFGIEVQGGRVLKLDATGNAKSEAAIRDGKMSAKVTGTLEGDTVKVESMDFQ
jgi:hypothetical protein